MPTTARHIIDLGPFRIILLATLHRLITGSRQLTLAHRRPKGRAMNDPTHEREYSVVSLKAVWSGLHAHAGELAGHARPRPGPQTPCTKGIGAGSCATAVYQRDMLPPSDIFRTVSLPKRSLRCSLHATPQLDL